MFAGLLSSCGSGNEEKPKLDKEVLDPKSSLNTSFDGKIFSIPSRMQTAILLEEINAPFNEVYLLFGQGILARDRCKKTLELFAERVIPRFR